MKDKSFAKNLLLVGISNFLGLILSVALNLLLPILFSNDILSYGFIQLYLMYIGYYYVFTLGICNGIYLKEGGKRFDSLDKNIYSAQFIIISVAQIVIGCVVLAFVFCFCNDYNKQLVYFATVVSTVILSVKELFLVVFQATSKMKEYSVMTILSKLFNVLTIVIAVIAGWKDLRFLLFGFVFGELIVLIYAMIRSKGLVFAKPCKFKLALKEAKSNVASGYTILVSGLTAMLITGFAKLCVENHWGIEAFAKISFTISIANLFMVFANAASVVLYPRLRNIDLEKCNRTYKQLNQLIVLLLFFAIGFCYPAKLALQSFLPEYKESLLYISILLPMCVFIGKTTIATQTYMKALRLEKQLMISNLLSFGVSAVLVIVSVYFLNSIIFTVFSILIGQILRAICCELFLSKTIKINVIKNVIVECIITACFILTHWTIGGWIGSVIYLLLVTLYMVIVFINKKIHKEKNENGKD